MSQSLAMVCEDCRVYLCVGQSSNSQGWFVYGTPEDMRTLSGFVHAHLGHRIRFMDSDAVGFDVDDVTEYDET